MEAAVSSVKKHEISMWLTSARRGYIISQLLALLWSGGNNSMPGKQLNPQHPVPHQQQQLASLTARICTRVEGSRHSSVIKSNQQQQQVPSIYQAGHSPSAQVFIKPAAA